MSAIVNIVLLSTAAGLGTGLGGLIAVIRRPGYRSFGLLMGFASGVMITLSFHELVAEAWAEGGWVLATIGFAAGAFVMFAIDLLTPHIRFAERENGTHSEPIETCVMTGEPVGRPPHRGHRRGHHPNWSHRYMPVNQKLLRTGMLMAIGISIHNMPEGIVVGAGYMHQPAFGIFIALAIALHNIPEGIATAMPLCMGGACTLDALRTTFLSGMVEPIGALLAALVLSSFQGLIPAALAFAGGVMVFLTLDELIPSAREHGHQHYTAIGIITGAVFVFVLSGTLGV